MLLYNSPISGNCYKVRLLLAHLGIPYERRELDVVDRSNRAEVLGGLNPDLRVPTLVLDDGRPIAESGAILWYFGEGTRFVPEERYDRGKVLLWMFFEQYSHEPAIAVVRVLVAYSGEADRYASVIERTGPDVDVLARLDDGRVVAVRERNVLATAFHPELAGETRFHRLLTTMAAEHDQPGEGSGWRPHPTRRSRQEA